MQAEPAGIYTTQAEPTPNKKNHHLPHSGQYLGRKNAHHTMFRPDEGGNKTREQSFSTDITHLTALF